MKIPRLLEGRDPPQGLSYKKLPATFCLFVRVKSRVVRLEVSKKFPWVGIKTMGFR